MRPNFEMPNLDSESRFSQLLYHGQTLVVQKLTESRFGIPKFGIPIEIRSGDLKNKQSTERVSLAALPR